jgi:hypothetical protein
VRALTIALCLLATPALADVAGAASVIDDDTIEVQGQRIRLHGIDAPESRQLCRLDGKPWQCGQDAANPKFLRPKNLGPRVINRMRFVYLGIQFCGAGDLHSKGRTYHEGCACHSDARAVGLHRANGWTRSHAGRRTTRSR